MSNKLYVANIAWAATENDIMEFFESSGFPAVSVRIIMDRETQRPKGFGFVELSDPEELERAIGDLNGAEFMGRKLNVAQAKPPTIR